MSTSVVAKIDFNQEQMAVIEKQFFPVGTSQPEQMYCFSVARELGLNPITREIHFVPRRQKVGDKWVTKVEPMVGRDGFLSIAHRSGQLAGMKTTTSIREVPQLVNGAWESRPDLVAECSVWRKDSNQPFTVQVSFKEYCQKTSDGSPTQFWSQKPETMLRKVAESQALRKAFNINGVYSPEELDAGYETAGGEILPPVIDVTLSRQEPERSRLSVVPPPQPPQPEPTPQVIDTSVDNWPERPEPLPASQSSSSTGSFAALERIVSLLESKNIPHEVDMETGIINAKSYNERQLLKDSGFKWSAETKSWILHLEEDPF